MINMFRSAALRLTIWYLALIMVVSLVFSGLLYHVSSNDLTNNANRQIGYFNNFLGPADIYSYSLLKDRQLHQDIDHLQANLIIFNLFVLAGGGAASYWLARRTLQPIEEALDAQSRFAADASHELRTPLTAIQAENEVALRNPSLKKGEAVALIKSNLEEVGKLRNLSEGLLRLANGRGQAFAALPVALKDIIPAAVKRLAKAATQKKVSIKDETGDLSVKGEVDSLIELFTIFIDNAIKYSPSGSRILLTSQRHHKDIQVTVTDYGKGIAAADLPMIFDRFFRADSSRSRQDSGGYGLGLAIAKKITEAHGGHIEVKSTPGKGSAFVVHLPSA